VTDYIGLWWPVLTRRRVAGFAVSTEDIEGDDVPREVRRMRAFKSKPGRIY
jgi:hypothetical protein